MVIICNIDTDEVFGYWEPLHYLLFDKGMQTWEYSPTFAIRSYAFLSPLWALGTLLNDSIFVPHKIVIFFLLRTCVGLFSLYCQNSFCSAIEWRINSNVGSMTRYLFYGSAGMFFYSTALLPSAVCCNLVMLCSSNYIRKHDGWGVFWGCFAVCCTGWPFVGVIFAPLGVHMLYRQVISSRNKVNRHGHSPMVCAIFELLRFLSLCFLILISVIALTVCFDSYMYQKW